MKCEVVCKGICVKSKLRVEFGTDLVFIIVCLIVVSMWSLICLIVSVYSVMFLSEQSFAVSDAVRKQKFGSGIRIVWWLC